MRLRTSADRHEIRQQYLPTLWPLLVQRLETSGGDNAVVDAVIELMDSYFLTKDDWDAILELGVGAQDMDGVKIPSQAKSAFTRRYNAASHPLPFMKASGAAVGPAKKSKDKPDLEEAIEDSEDEALVDPVVDEDDEELDLKKDKYVQAPKKRKAPAKKAKKGAEADEDSEEEKPVKAKGKKGKGKGKK